MNCENTVTTMRGKRARDAGGVMVPAGLLIGLGVGFLVGHVAAGLFIGLGAGFLLLALTTLRFGK